MDDKIFFLERMSFDRIFALAAELGYPVTDKRWRATTRLSASPVRGALTCPGFAQVQAPACAIAI